jgi:hypothetical protein
VSTAKARVATSNSVISGAYAPLTIHWTMNQLVCTIDDHFQGNKDVSHDRHPPKEHDEITCAFSVS